MQQSGALKGENPPSFRYMRQLVLYKAGKPSMLYIDDCGCEPAKKKRNFPKWIGDLLVTFMKGVIGALFK